MTYSSVRIGTTSTPRVRKQLGIVAANTGMVEGMLSGMEVSGSKRGEFYLPSRHLLYATQVVTLDLCPSVIKLIRDLAGGALIMLPPSFRDWANPDIAPILRRT